MQFNQLTDTVVMVPPDQFGFNSQTAKTNLFQNKPTEQEEIVKQKAIKEFDKARLQLENSGIKVIILEGKKDAITPDAVFPNNWFSVHPGKIIIYPMLTENRRNERQPENLKKILSTMSNVFDITDLSQDEKSGLILEGTGSLVLDRERKVAFAMESPRTSKEEFYKWCRLMGYEGFFFHAFDGNNFPVYHTNMVMSIGQEFAVVCLESIMDEKERNDLQKKLIELGKKIIPISIDQMKKSCGNILQLASTSGSKKIVLSKTALLAFTDEKIKILKEYGDLIVLDMPVIESVGGGSARCLLAEVFYK